MSSHPDASWSCAGLPLRSRLFLGTARYPSEAVLRRAIAASGAEVVTLGLKPLVDAAAHREGASDLRALARDCGVRVLPNTAGCENARDAVALAWMARELFDTPWVKLEVTGQDGSLAPDPFELVRAAGELAREGFEVLPYCTDDLVVGQRLLDAGCRVLMPWASPIGSAAGLSNPAALRRLRERWPELVLIVDAGLGSPADAAQAMELGFDGVLLNSAVAGARDPVGMAQAFSLAVRAGRLGFESGLVERRRDARRSTPVAGAPFSPSRPADLPDEGWPVLETEGPRS